MMEVTASGLVTQRFLHGMQASQLDALAETASEVMFPCRAPDLRRRRLRGQVLARCESGYVALDVLVPGEGQVVIGRVGLGGLVGWSWLLPPYRWAFGAVCVTEVKAFQFNAQAVRGALRGRSGAQAMNSRRGCSRWSRGASRTPGPG